MLKEKWNRRFLLLGLVSILLVVPAILFAKNYHSHDRTGDYMPWDYSYNLLQSCEEGGILFTNGDNDTFPLWYLQEVEGIRKDVRVVNLSLLNTGWYIKQLKNRNPKMPIIFPNKTIEQLEPFAISDDNLLRLLHESNPKVIPNGRKSVLSLSIDAPENPDGQIMFNVKPTVSGIGLRVQDLMIIHLLEYNDWEKPVYFAVTVPRSNRAGLDNYLTMEGVVFRVSQKTIPRSGISSKSIAQHFLDPLTSAEFSQDYDPRYRFRALNDSTIHFGETTLRLVGNYRQAIMQLAADYVTRAKRKQEGEGEILRTKARNALNKMEELIPQKLLPMSPDLRANLTVLEADLGDLQSLDALKEDIANPKISLSRRLSYADLMLDIDPNIAVDLIEEIRFENPDDVDVISLLVAAYDLTKNYEKAIALLDEWLDINPTDQSAKTYRKELQGKMDLP